MKFFSPYFWGSACVDHKKIPSQRLEIEYYKDEYIAYISKAWGGLLLINNSTGFSKASFTATKNPVLQATNKKLCIIALIGSVTKRKCKASKRPVFIRKTRANEP